MSEHVTNHTTPSPQNVTNEVEKTNSSAALINAYNKTRNNTSHKKLCYAPDTNMYFTQDGKVKVCCNNFHYTIGSYPEQTIHEIWNSQQAHEIRNKMQQYDFSLGCNVCESDFKSRNFQQVPAQHFDTLLPVAQYPRMMEFLLTNTCNLECVMCRGENSSLIRKNREKLPPIHNPYDKNFLTQLHEFVPHLKETRFSGSGEAFSIDINYTIWEMILNQNPECLIMVQTNGTILTSRVKNMLDRGNFEIGVSIDSLQKKTYEAIRLNANFDKVIQNIHFFHQYSQKKNKQFRMSFCVMRQNWQEMPDFIRFCNELNAIATFHKVWSPIRFALFNLPAIQLSQIYNQLSSIDFPSHNSVEQLNRAHYHYFVSTIKQWMEEAPARETQLEFLNTLNADELLAFLKRNIKEELNSISTSIQESNAQYEFCSQKLDEILSVFKSAETREEILKTMATTIPAKEWITAFKQYSVEFIREQTIRL